MEPIKLYRLEGKDDPISTAVKVWAMLCEVKGFEEHLSGYYWNAVGDLPVIGYRNYVFAKHHVLEFLSVLYDLDLELSCEERSLSYLIQEICVNSLYPSTLYALWMDDTTPKDFFTPKRNILWNIINLPATKIQYFFKKRSIAESLNAQHGLNSPDQALILCKSAHKALSDLLGNKFFFLSKSNRRHHPRRADIIVYSYISYQLKFLSSHPHVTESLNKYQNLIDFIIRVEDCIRLKAKAGLAELKDFEFVFCPSGSDQEFYFAKVYPNNLESSNEHWNQIKYRLGEDEPLMRYPITDISKRQKYITGIAVIVFLFVYLRKQ